MSLRVAALAGLITLLSAAAAAQEREWAADITIGYAGFVDDATKHFLLAGGGVRRYITPRVSIGPEIVVMSGSDTVRDRNVMLTGNVVFDVFAFTGTDARRVTPFLVAGGGMFWGRDLVRGGPFWSSDPAFTAGGGVRARLADSVSAAADYRLGWELHQRLSGTVSLHW